MSDKKTIFVAHDIEKAGTNLIAHPVISIGFFVGESDGTELFSRKFNFRVAWPDGKGEMGDFEPRCWNEFWTDEKGDYRRELVNPCLLDPTPQEPSVAWAEVKAFLDDLEERFPEDQYKIKFVTDNASFDTASIDYGLEKYCGRPPMRYSSSGKYRSVVAADDMLDMLPIWERTSVNREIDQKAVHDHDPVHDAQYIYWQAVYAFEKISKANKIFNAAESIVKAGLTLKNALGF